VTAARSTSTQARLSRPRIDTFTERGIIPRPVAKCKTMKRLGEPMPNDAALARALALVRDLRARCPWDGAQTPETLRPYLVEEVLELDQALRNGNPAELRDELGDLLLHLAFQIAIGEEREVCDAESGTSTLEAKNCRGQPHLLAGA